MLVKSGFVNRPEIRYFESGKAVFSFDLAISKYNAKTKKADGIACYYKVEVWGDEAADYADKIQEGDRISIASGSLSSASYENKQGQKVYKPLIQFPEGIEVLYSKNPKNETEENLDSIPF